MSSIRSRLFAVLALVAAGAFAVTSVARAGEDTPPAKAAPESKPAAEAPKTTDAPKTDEAAKAPDTKTPSPMHTLMGWVAKQVAPSLECGCPSTPEGEKAWRGWFDGGKDVPLATLRDAMVADGWTAERFVGFFKAKRAQMASGECAKGDCAKGDCAKGDCAKGDCKDCKGGCPNCEKCKKDAAKADAPKPETAPAKPEPAVATK